MAEAVEDLRDIILGDSPNRDLGAADELLDEEDTNGGQDQGETKAASEDEDGDEAHMILQVMSESIKTLFRIGMLVRKSGTRDRFRRALQMSSSTFPPIFDIDYVGQKYPKLRGRGHDIATNRLGSAIAKRRQFIKYGREHSARLATAEVAPKVEETPTPTFEETTPKIPEISLPAMSERVSSKATTLQVARFTRKLSAEELNEEPEDDKATVMTASTTTDNLASLKLPFLEDLSHDNGPFECPFCFTLQTFKTERSWKTHAFNDLKAYLCTVGGADCDDLLFGDRNTCLGEVTLFKVVKTQIGKQYALAEFASAQGERAVLTASPILVGRWCLQVRTWRDFVGLSSSSSQAAADDAFGILQWACYTNTPKRATAVLDQGLIDINNQIRMSSKRLLLHDAAFYGSLDMVILLLHHDVDINGRDSMGQTPLILAAKAGDVEVASLLLSYGSDATLRDKSGWDALFYAAGQLASHDGMEDVIPELIAAGCDPNSKNPKSKMTPLTWAVTNGNEQMTEILLAAGCMVPVNLPGDTPIVLAAARGHAGIVEKLIQHGSDPSIRKSGQMEPLICAVKNGHEDVVSVLLAAGADLHWRDELGMTALMRAVQSGNVRIVEQLLQAGSSVYDVDDKNLTVLGYALNYGRSYRKANVLMIKKLLEAGADLNLAGRNGDYALHWAVRSMPREHNQGRLSASELERPDRWDQIGADQGPEAVVQVLIEHGASVNSRDKEGTTPLALAAERGLPQHYR
ncbi:hypothetical protein ACHAQA_001739 [Verticillium albo-atrum]